LAGITAESLSRFERGRSAEFGARKLLAVLAVLGAELDVVTEAQSGNLDALRLERANASKAPIRS
jgi:transcriptional regulator with XRE-family HTH domain